jgi:hypothetical protein
MLDQILAQDVGIADEVAQRTCCICPCFLFLVSQQLNQQNHTGPQVLIKNVVVKSCIADSETSKLACVPVDISTAFYSSRDQTELEQLFVEEPCVTAEVAKKVTNFSPNVGVLVTNQHFKIGIDVGVMYGLIKVFADSCELANQ